MRHQSSPAKRKAAAKRKALIRQRALACSTTSTASRSPKRGSSAKQVVPATSNSFVQALRQHLPTRLINRLARQTGFQQRQAKKLSPTNFLLSATLLITQSTLSLRTWAVLIGWIIQGTFTKQSLHERLNGSAVRFLEAILQALLNSVGQLASAPVPPSLAFFARVILHDSTCAKLSEKLAAAFPGPSNPKGTRPGMLKVQAAYDLLAHTFVHFSLSS